MSLLSSTQGTPERVWSLIHLLAAHKGSLPRDEILAWLSPTFVQGRQARVVTGERDGQALGAATSLGLIARDGGAYGLSAPPAESFAAFADQVHDRLRSVGADDPDFVVLETFAWLAAEAERRQSTGWAKAQEFADAVEHAIGGEEPTGERRFNSTKLPPWRRWIILIGLGLELPGNLGFYPYVAERLLREINASDLPRDVDLPGAQVLAEIARRLPYLDGGPLFTAACSRIGVRLPPARISRLISVALRDLNDEGVLLMGLRGDATDRFELTPDGQHPIQTFQTLRLVSARP